MQCSKIVPIERCTNDVATSSSNGFIWKCFREIHAHAKVLAFAHFLGFTSVAGSAQFIVSILWFKDFIQEFPYQWTESFWCYNKCSDTEKRVPEHGTIIEGQ